MANPQSIAHRWPDHPLALELDTALKACRQAGLLCRSVQRSVDPGSMQKSDRSPVTVADFGSQALICRDLEHAFPDDPVIGEEDSGPLRKPENEALLDRVLERVRDHVPDAETETVCSWIDRGNHLNHNDRFWTLDPVDGTKGFLRGEQYTIALALIIDGVIEVGVMVSPNLAFPDSSDAGTGTIFFALRGYGAWQIPFAGSSEPCKLQVNDQSDPTRIRFCESVEAAHSSHGGNARVAAELGITADPVRMDSLAKYGLVSRADAEAYLRLPKDSSYREKIWDHAPGVLLVQEAGGRVTDVAGRELDFGRGHLLETTRGVVVSNGRVHDRILEAVARNRPR